MIMIIVKLKRGLRRTRRYSNCDGWIHNPDTDSLAILQGREHMASFPAGTWAYVEDRTK